MDLNKLRFSLSSPPDREFLVADIFWGNEQIAEINRETGKLEIEIYPRRSGDWWKLNYEEFIKVIEKAKEELSQRFD